MTRLQSAATAVLTATALSLSAQAAELDDTAAMLTGSIHFGGVGHATTAQLNLQTVARSRRFDQEVPLGGLHWDSQIGLAPSVLGMPLTATSPLYATETNEDGSGWSWLGWAAGGLAVSVWLLHEFAEAFLEGFGEGIAEATFAPANDDENDADAGNEEPCEPGPLSPIIGSGCR